MSATVPNGFRMVTCPQCKRQQLIEDGATNEKCYCGSYLSGY